MGMLSCTKCKKEYAANLENFPPNNKTKNKLDSWCRPCRKEYRKAYRKPPDGISKEEWSKFNNLTGCIICGTTGKLVTDHCHSSFVVRGKLCSNCNLGLGHFKDDPLLLEFARLYLLNYSDKQEDQEELQKYIDTHNINGND